MRSAELPATPGAPSLESATLPGTAHIEVPEVNTASPELPAGDAFTVPGVPATPATGAPALGTPPAPAAPDLTGTAALSAGNPVDTGLDQGGAPGAGEGQDELGAMQSLDSAALLQELARTPAPGGAPATGLPIG